MDTISCPSHGDPDNEDDIHLSLPEELQKVRAALAIVYHPTLPTTARERQRADLYLVQFQSRDSAWMVCDELLRNPISPPHQQQPPPPQGSVLLPYLFFAATTLHAKIRSDLYQLPRDALPSLRDSLVQHLLSYLTTSTSTTTSGGGGSADNAALPNRLAGCISALAIAMRWTTILDDIFRLDYDNYNNNNNNPDAAAGHRHAGSGGTGAASSNSTNNTTKTALIRLILRTLPEECADDRYFETSDRLAMRDHLLAKATSPVFTFLQQQQEQEEHHHHHHAASTASSSSSSYLQILLVWIRFVPLPAPVLLAAAPLLGRLFSHHLVAASASNSNNNARSLEMVELATDVLIELFRMYGPGDVDHNNNNNNRGLVNWLIQQTLALPLEAALTSGQEDIVRCYCRIWTELGESYLILLVPPTRPLLSNNNNNAADDPTTRTTINNNNENDRWNAALATKLLTQILRCTEIPAAVDHHHHDSASSMTLFVWYRLIVELDQGVPDYRWRQELIDLHTPLLLKLVDVCVRQLIKYPDDVQEYAEDMLEELIAHRQYVAETIEDCCRLLGGHVVLQTIGQALRRQEPRTNNTGHHLLLHHHHLHHHQHHGGGHNTTTTATVPTWQGLEACLAALAAIYRFVPADESEILPYVLSQLPLLLADTATAAAAQPVFLRQTCHQVIGKYAAWLSQHTELLQPLLPLLSQGLLIGATAGSSAQAIRELCSHSNVESFSIAAPALQLYEEWTPGRLKLPDELLLLEGVCLAASRQVAAAAAPPNDPRGGGGGGGDGGRDVMTRLAQPIGRRLAAHLADPNASARWIEAELDRLTTLVQTLKIGSASIMELIQTAWPLLSSSMQRFPGDVQLAEKICRFHKHSIRSCGPRAYAPLFDALAKQLVDCFHATRLSSFLYCASICVSDFGNDAMYTDRLNNMLGSLSSTVFAMLQNLENFTNHPDVVEEYFYLVERVVSHIPGSLTDRSMVSSLVHCAAIGMQVDHKGANKGTHKFIASLLSFALQSRGSSSSSSSSPNGSPVLAAVEYALTENGQLVVNHLIGALTLKLPCYSKEIPDIIWKLNTLCPGLLAQWMAAALAQETRVPERYRIEFLNALGLGLSRSELRFGVEAFQDACYRERRRLYDS